VSHPFEILVRGIDDAAVVGTIETAIRDSLQQLGGLRAWRVVVRPSCENGRWEFSFDEIAGRHVLSIAAPADLLPDLGSCGLQASLPPGRVVESTERQNQWGEIS
jgi:hypothetical protein